MFSKKLYVVNFVFMMQWEKMYVIKHYVPEHSCIPRATRNKKVTGPIVNKIFRDMISTMTFIKTGHLKIMVKKELGVFITDKLYRDTKRLSIIKTK